MLSSDAVSTNFDPDDNRTLYDRLKEQRDAKQEEWEAALSFNIPTDWEGDPDAAQPDAGPRRAPLAPQTPTD